MTPLTDFGRRCQAEVVQVLAEVSARPDRVSRQEVGEPLELFLDPAPMDLEWAGHHGLTEPLRLRVELVEPTLPCPISSRSPGDVSSPFATNAIKFESSRSTRCRSSATASRSRPPAVVGARSISFTTPTR